MSWFTKRSSKRSATRPVLRAQPQVEGLERREVPTVTYHGGALLQHVEVQALCYGSDWYTNRANYQMTGQIESYLRYLVRSPYMDMLTNAGYWVGRGSWDQGRILPKNINKQYYLNDSTIQSDLLSLIRNGSLKRNDANRLYIIFVEPSVAVRLQNGDNSIRNFEGYHSAVNGVAYAVIPYQAGFNGHERGLSAFDSATAVVSHELAEAVTDPMTNGRRGWYDESWDRIHHDSGEIGDIVAHQLVRLNGYVVQKEAGKNDQPLSPVGSTPVYYRFSGLSGTSAASLPSPSAYSTQAQLPKGWLAVLDVTLRAKPESSAVSQIPNSSGSGFTDADGYVNPFSVAHLGPWGR
jgi:hypothetical protein